MSPRLRAFLLDPCGETSSIILIAKHILDQIWNRKLKSEVLKLKFRALFPILCFNQPREQWLNMLGLDAGFFSQVCYAQRARCHLKQPLPLPFCPLFPLFTVETQLVPDWNLKMFVKMRMDMIYLCWIPKSRLILYWLILKSEVTYTDLQTNNYDKSGLHFLPVE